MIYAPTMLNQAARVYDNTIPIRIIEKKIKEKEAIDEYRKKIQKDFDVKQKEFLEK